MMPHSRKHNWSPPADVAMDIIAMFDGDIEKAREYVVEMQVVLKQLSLNDLSEWKARKIGQQNFLNKIFNIIKAVRKRPKEQYFSIVDTGSGLVHVSEYDDDFESGPRRKQRRGKGKLAA